MRNRLLASAAWLLSPNDNPYHNWCVKAGLCVLGLGVALIVMAVPV